MNTVWTSRLTEAVRGEDDVAEHEHDDAHGLRGTRGKEVAVPEAGEGADRKVERVCVPAAHDGCMGGSEGG